MPTERPARAGICSASPVALNLQATSASKFNLKLLSLGASGAAGAVTNFNKDTNYSWTIASTTGSVTNFDASKFNLDTSSFSNDLAGGYFFVESGSLKISFTNNHAPVAGTATYIRPAGLTFKIAIANLLPIGPATRTTTRGALTGI